MYNRYIGNTGKFYRVEDVDPVPPMASPAPETDRREVLRSWEEVRAWEEAQAFHAQQEREQPREEPEPPQAEPEREQRQEQPPPPPPPPPEPEAERSKFDFGKVFQTPSFLRQFVRDKLPGGLDLGDILLVLVLLYLFLEGDDDDMLIILGILLFTWIRPLFKKGEETDSPPASPV